MIQGKDLRLINQDQIEAEFSPILEQYGINDSYKKSWVSVMASYRENHDAKVYESNRLFESQGYSNLTNNLGMGSITAPGQGYSSYNGANPSHFNNPSYRGSGDKFNMLFPMMLQIATKTIAFDLVNVIPMPGPSFLLPYGDFVYAGGRLTSSSLSKAAVIQVTDYTVTTALANGTTYWAIKASTTSDVTPATDEVAVKLVFIGNSFVTGNPMFKVVTTTNTLGDTVAVMLKYDGSAWAAAASTDGDLSNIFDGTAVIVTDSSGEPSGTKVGASTGIADYVSAIENHIQGFSGAGFDDTADWTGPYVSGTKVFNPLSRSTGETTYPRGIQFTMHSKRVDAGTIQVYGTASWEQIQDTKTQYGFDLMGMISDVLVHNLSTTISLHLLNRLFALGWTHNSQFYTTQGYTANISLLQSGNTTSKTYVGMTDTTSGTVAIAVQQAVDDTAENQLSRVQKIRQAIMQAAGAVQHRGKLGAPNFLVCNSRIRTILAQQTNWFLAKTDISVESGSLYEAGEFEGMKVYVDPLMQWSDTRVLIGRKGKDTDPGLKFLPYLMAEEVRFISEGTSSPKIVMKSRYAVAEVGFYPQNQYYTLFIEVPTTY